MSTWEKIIVILPKEDSRKSIIHKVHLLLKQAGAFMDEDCLCILNDLEGKEFEPILGLGEEKTLSTLIDWPTLGTIDYVIFDYSIVVSFTAQIQGPIVAVAISIPSSRFFGERAKFYTEFYHNLARQIHQTLQATRTFFAWEPFYDGGTIYEEVQRVREGICLGDYSLDER